MVTTIQVDESTKEKLEKLKIHKRQPFNEIILELIDVKENSQNTEEKQKKTSEMGNLAFENEVKVKEKGKTVYFAKDISGYLIK